jgi:hypothetical protein
MAYISEPLLRVKRREKAFELVAKVKSNMKNKQLPVLDKLIPRKKF